MRSLLVELRPSALTDTDLGDLLRLLGNAFTGRTNVPVAVSVSGTGTLPPEAQVVLYRICEEALNNITKHARASNVELDMRHEAGALELHIRMTSFCGLLMIRLLPNLGVRLLLPMFSLLSQQRALLTDLKKLRICTTGSS